MADISIDNLANQEQSFGSIDIFKTGNSVIKQRDTLQKRKDATVAEKFDSMIDAAGQNHLASDIGSWAIEKAYFDKDDSYVTDDDITLENMKINKLPMKYYGAIRNAESKAEEHYQILKAQREISIDEKINESLGSVGRTTAGIVGAVGDVDMLVGVGVGSLYGVGESFAKIMAYEGVAEASLIAIRSSLDKDYTMQDAFIDGTIGLFVAGGSAKLSAYFHGRHDSMYGDIDEYIEATELTDKSIVATKRGFQDFDPNVKVDIDFSPPTRQSTIDTINAGKKKNLDVKVRAERARVELAKKTKGTPEFKAEEVRLETVRKKISSMIDGSYIKPDVKAPRIKDKNVESTVNLAGKLDPILKEVKETTEEVVESLSKEELGVFTKELKDIGVDAAETKALVKSGSKKDIDSFAEKHKLSSKQKKMLIGTVAMLSTTGAMAGEDNYSDEITGVFLAVAIGLVGGSALLSKMKRVKTTGGDNFKATIASLHGRVDKAYREANMEVSPEAGLTKKVGNLIMDTVSTRVTSTVAPFMKAGGTAKKIMNDLVYSAKGGSGAEVTKAMWSHALMFKYASFEQKYYKEWMLENQKTMTSNMFDDMKAIHEFRAQLTDAMDNVDINGNRISSGSASLDAMVKENDKLLESIYARAKEYEVYGFEKIGYKKGMISRLWNAGELNTLINKLDNPDDVAKFTNAIKNAIYKHSGDMEQATKTAERFVNGWAKGFSPSSASGGTDVMNAINPQENLWGSLGNLMKDDVEYNDFLDAMNVPKDRSARAKYRVDFDIKDIEPFEIMIDGKVVMIDKSVFVNRDFKSILDTVSNQINGSSALAQKGYKSRASLNKAINDGVTDQTMRNELMQVADLVQGVPIPSNNKFLHDISMIVKDLTMVAKLPLVVFSMPPEFISTITNGGFFKGLKELGSAFKSMHGKESYMMRQLSEVSGLGTSTKRIDVSGYRGLTDDVTNLDDAGVVSGIRAGTMKMRDLSMLMNGLSYFSDVAQRANLAINTEKLAKYFTGLDTKRIADTRAAVYGIDDATIARFKNKFTFTDGNLDDFDISKWSMKDQDEFGEMLRIMNQETTPETTMGETGLYTRTTDLGRAMSSLISYPMQQFNIHGVDDFRHMDRMALAHSVGGFMGAYIGLNARYAVQDKDVDDETIMMYALLNVPQLGGYSAITSLLDPASFQMMKSASDIISLDAR